ncbi:hypothetical protein FN846DRAFT_913428 [Sphaerosporella brunnea]|uniref:DUF6826 domain-containing protein n=1 Tax=Sphaerosporella brunnea TaxID=1250544 RepID=A0A5J5EEE5_9PEZI|nr:hypothetical protein FN846DRAFT_913428 [Sphaerosporella brunnea]
MPISEDVVSAWFKKLAIAHDGGADSSAEGYGYTFFCDELHRLFTMLKHDLMRAFALPEPKRLWKAVVDNATRGYEVEIARLRGAEAAHDRSQTEMKVENAALHTEIVRLQTENAALHADIVRLQAETVTLKADIDRVKTDFADKKARRKEKEQKLEQEKERLLKEKEQEKEKLVKEKDALMSSNRHVLTRMENMERELNAHQVTRSATHAGRWMALKQNKGFYIDDLPVKDLDELSRAETVLVNMLLNIDFPTEISMYNPIVLVLRRLFGDSSAAEKVPEKDTPHFMAEAAWQALHGATATGDKLASVLQTHDHRYLDNYAPDLAICHKTSIIEEPGSIVCVAEVKPTTTDRFNSHMLGQTWDYLHSTVKAQPHRRNVVAVLSSLKRNVVLMHDSQTQVTTQYRECTLADVIRYIRGVVLVQPGYGAHPFPWGADIGAPMRPLGKPRHTAVAEFKIPDAMLDDLAADGNAPVSDFCKGEKLEGRRRTQERFVNRSNRASCMPEMMAVKRLVQNTYPLVPAPRDRSFNSVTDSTTGVSDEINILLKIDKLGAPTTQPIILYHTADFKELAGDGGARSIKGILIDLGEAVNISDRRRAHYFRGGYTCYPLRLMQGKVQTESAYHPVLADDYATWLLLVNSLMYLKPWLTAPRASGKVLCKNSTEQTKMIRFWEELMVMDGWDRFYQAADQERVNELRRLSGFVHWV